jgi:hypothetical protein
MRHLHYWHALRWTFVNAAAAAVVMLVVRAALEPKLGESLGVLIGAAAAGVVTYLALAGVLERVFIKQLLRMLRPTRLAGTTSA